MSTFEEGQFGPADVCSQIRTLSYIPKMLSPGSPAPLFELPDQNGTIRSLQDQRGHWVLLWWYPKASTRG
jgi:AhpC/TSA family